jgi:large subunit ribosomal protein L31
MANLHPNYKKITVVMTNGETFETRSTYQNKVLNLDTDIHTHPAWKKTTENYVNLQANEVAKFNKKFGGIDFMMNVANSAA